MEMMFYEGSSRPVYGSYAREDLGVGVSRQHIKTPLPLNSHRGIGEMTGNSFFCNSQALEDGLGSG
jgi:hypothetical protein